LTYPPIKPRPKRIVAIPSTLFASENLKLKTIKVGFLARALAIFRVEEVVIYVDKGERVNAELIADILRYIETPQYLRKVLIPLKPKLKYVGLIPPLRTPHHPTRDEKVEFREGVVVFSRRGRVKADVGLKEPVIVQGHERMGKRVTVKLRPSPAIVPKSVVPYYWGYSVRIESSLSSLLKRTNADLRIATSRCGDNVVKVWDRLKDDLKRADRVLVVFGAPDRGLFEMCEEEGLDIHEFFNYILNFIPDQGTRTVRTEEALYATLAILNILA